MGLGSRGFLPSTLKLPQIVVQRGSPHDLIRNVRNELDSALFCKVLGHQAKTYFFSSQPMGSARSCRVNATSRVELQENSYFAEGA